MSQTHIERIEWYDILNPFLWIFAVFTIFGILIQRAFDILEEKNK